MYQPTEQNSCFQSVQVFSLRSISSSSSVRSFPSSLQSVSLKRAHSLTHFARRPLLLLLQSLFFFTIFFSSSQSNISLVNSSVNVYSHGMCPRECSSGRQFARKFHLKQIQESLQVNLLGFSCFGASPRSPVNSKRGGTASCGMWPSRHCIKQQQMIQPPVDNNM